LPVGRRPADNETAVLRTSRRRVLVAVALGGILGYASLLRLDALFGKYGPFTHPTWVVVLQNGVAGVRDVMVPDDWIWTPPDRKYYGDPQNYIRFAREMRHFYQAHVREPVFLAATRVFLVLTGGQAEAVSFASASFSVLCVLAVFLWGRALHSNGVGLAAAAAVTIERELIQWAPDGWRDDAYMAMVAFSAWAMVRLSRQPGPTWATVFGVMAAGACLTRVSALLFIAPVLAAFIALGDRAGLKARARSAAIATLAFAVLTGPYFVSITLETGDPFFAVNYHTIYYLDHEGQDPNQGLSAAEYIGGKFRAAPIATSEIAVRGLTDVPFENKWHGFESWLPGLGPLLRLLAIGGLLGWLFVPAGRLLLIMLLGTIAPYMVTWSVGGGGAFHFTMPAYPFYLVASCWSAGELVRLVVETRDRARLWRLLRLALPRLAIAGGVLGSLWLFNAQMPYFVARESIGAGVPTTIAAGNRDRAFFVEGWTTLAREGNVTARLAAGERAVLVIPLPDRRAYHVVLRMDPLPFHPDQPQRVRAFVDGRAIAEWPLSSSPDRVGAYAFDIPAGFVEPGRRRLELVSDFTRPMAETDGAFPEIARDQHAAFRFWLARVTPN
jgi:hypothetical protein